MIGLFAIMVGIAAFNRIVLTPSLVREAPQAARQLAIDSSIELGLGFAVLAIVGVLGTVQPAGHHHMAPTAGIPDDAAFGHIHGDDAMADVTVNLGRVGRATIVIRVLRGDLSELSARSVDLTLIPPAGAATPIAREAIRQTDGSWHVNGIDLPEAGSWTVKVLVAVSALGTLPVLDAPVVIEGRR